MASQAKNEAIALLTQMATKVARGVILVVASQFLALILSKYGKVTLSTKFFSALRLLNWCEWFSRPQPWGSLLVSLKAFVYVDGQPGRTGRYQVPSLGKLENVSKWGL